MRGNWNGVGGVAGEALGVAVVMYWKRMEGHWEDWAGVCRGTGGVRVRSGVSGPWEETLL